ncbi:MAG TPA: hypothetical protein VHT27_04525 [Solirubrobacteraceae bacterium]|jgi:alpha-tubulin suppressor-like RCC1 family protein|nr:hypothetical protein [Solirubrobacteraceae bacterium]
MTTANDSLFRHLLLALAVVLASLAAATASASAHPSGARVSASIVAVGDEVTARGVLRGALPSGLGPRAQWRAQLQQNVGGRWLRRASAHVRANRGLTVYSVAWTGAPRGRQERLRVAITSGSRVVAVSTARLVASTSPVSVQRTLRGSTVQAAPGQVVRASGSANSTMTVVLARGARVPRVGAALVVEPGAQVPRGLVGVVTAVARISAGVSVTTRPGTLDDAYSSFAADVNGKLGELAEASRSHASSRRAHSAVNLGIFDASFSCDGPAGATTITHHIDLSELEVHAEVDIPSPGDGFYGPYILFTIGGQPKFNLGVKFSAQTSCNANATAKIPIPDTPLLLEIGPDFSVKASGAVGAELEWTPRLFYGFSRGRGAPSNDWHSFHTGGRTNFYGNANLTIGLALQTGLSLGGRVGLRGSAGPEVTGMVASTTSPPQTCLSANADFAANLVAFANAFFKDYTFTIGSATFGHVQLYHNCTGPTGSGGGGGGGSGGGSGPPPASATCEASGCAGGAATPIGNVSAAVAGGISPCALIVGGTIDCWGSNEGGQLGDGSLSSGAFESHPTPVAVASISSATGVSVSGDHTCAVVGSGKVYCWGLASYGQLGNESESPSANPAPVEATTTHEAAQVSAGDDYTCVVLFSGHVVCWGYNAQGELGNGSTTNSLSGVTVTGLSGVTDLASGEDADGTGHTCAITGGNVYCWGDNREGQLGNGTVKNSDTPVQVPGITNAVQVTAGDETTCALIVSGSIKCWGYNAGGTLGDGTTEDSATPVTVQGITNATSVSAGTNVTCAGLATHVAECWGFGVAGALGDGSQTGSTTPVQVSDLTDVSSVTAGYSMGCAVRVGGGLDCWGGDVFGQLGNGAGGASARGFSAFPLAVSAP